MEGSDQEEIGQSGAACCEESERREKRARVEGIYRARSSLPVYSGGVVVRRGFPINISHSTSEFTLILKMSVQPAVTDSGALRSKLPSNPPRRRQLASRIAVNSARHVVVLEDGVKASNMHN
jgi:hypothetical protein